MASTGIVTITNINIDSADDFILDVACGNCGGALSGVSSTIVVTHDTFIIFAIDPADEFPIIYQSDGAP